MAKKRLDSEKVRNALGAKVRALRLKKGWTLEECEDHGWPHWRSLQRIEVGMNVKLETLVSLANLFGVSIQDLFD